MSTAEDLSSYDVEASKHDKEIASMKTRMDKAATEKRRYKSQTGYHGHRLQLKGPMTNEETSCATYDEVFERNTRASSLDRELAVKIYETLLCCKTALSPSAPSQALGTSKY